jgi:hypothetical protein
MPFASAEGKNDPDLAASFTSNVLAAFSCSFEQQGRATLRRGT